MEEEDEIMDMDMNMDESWIKEFQETDKLYEKYYLDDLYHIKVNSIYVDDSKNIVKIKEERIMMKENNVLTRDELVGILKKNSQYNNKQFAIQTILKYNINLEPTDIEDFLKNKKTQSFLSAVNHIEDIPFQKTITMFQDLNDLYLLYMEKNKERKNVTKRVVMQKPSGKTNKRR
jgi:hypothetical protein